MVGDGVDGMNRDYGVDTIVLRLEWPVAPRPATYAGRVARMRPLGAGGGFRSPHADPLPVGAGAETLLWSRDRKGGIA